jgi:hypothetical protein
VDKTNSFEITDTIDAYKYIIISDVKSAYVCFKLTFVNGKLIHCYLSELNYTDTNNQEDLNNKWNKVYLTHEWKLMSFLIKFKQITEFTGRSIFSIPLNNIIHYLRIRAKKKYNLS